MVEVVEPPKDYPGAAVEVGEKTAISRMIHWGTAFAYSLIIYIGSVSTFFAIQWLPLTTVEGVINLNIFLVFNFLTLNNLFKASYFGAGYVPKGWRPSNKEDEEKLQFCMHCKGFKVPRSHHCSKCNRCCMKMDHHCPWINNCVGYRNHIYFLRFLFFAIIGCLHAVLIDCFALYHAIHAGWYMRYGDGSYPIIILTMTTFILLIIAIALALAVAIALTILLFTQIRCIMKNMNSIEEYIHDKAVNLREKVKETNDPEDEEYIKYLGEWTYPYNLGRRRNFQEVFPSWFSASPKGNGTWWPVIKGCDQFTFTTEQLKQKQSKRDRARPLVITENFTGSILSSCKYGLRVFFRQPIIDGRTLPVQVGDKIVATRGTGGWAYGFREEKPLEKGWVPIKATNLEEYNLKSGNVEEKEKKKDE